MLKILRYDFYKIFKSKALLGVFIASVCLSFLDSIFVGLTSGEFYVWLNLNGTLVVQFLPVVFVVPFVCKDFSSKFLKNVFSEYSFGDKICYVLSKIIYVFAVCVVWYVVYLLSSLAVVYIYSSINHVPFHIADISYDGTVMQSKSQVLFKYFCFFINAFTISTIVLFLCFLTKREYIVVVVILIYWFALSFPIYNAINAALGFKTVNDAMGPASTMEEMLNAADWFTVFGIQHNLSQPIYDASGTIDMMSVYKRCALVCTGYSVLFCILSCVLFASKKKC